MQFFHLVSHDEEVEGRDGRNAPPLPRQAGRHICMGKCRAEAVFPAGPYYSFFISISILNSKDSLKLNTLKLIFNLVLNN